MDEWLPTFAIVTLAIAVYMYTSCVKHSQVGYQGCKLLFVVGVGTLLCGLLAHLGSYWHSPTKYAALILCVVLACVLLIVSCSSADSLLRGDLG